MKNIFYTSSLFHKAVKRNKPKEIYFYFDFWFSTQKAIIAYTPRNSHEMDAMLIWLKKQNIEVVNVYER